MYLITITAYNDHPIFRNSPSRIFYQEEFQTLEKCLDSLNMAKQIYRIENITITRLD